MPWEASVFDEIVGAREVTVVMPAPERPTVRVPIWVVAVDGALYVRSWKGEGGVWYRRALSSGAGALATGSGEHRAWFVPVADPELDAAIDAEFLGKYGDSSYSRAMIEPPATGTTMRLEPVS